MTPSNIDKMPAGREMDALVAEKVMDLKTRKVRFLESYGYEPGHTLKKEYQKTNFEEALVAEMDDGEILYWDVGCKSRIVLNTVPRYSEKIAAAWEVVEKMETWGSHSVTTEFEKQLQGCTDCCFGPTGYVTSYTATEFALEICRAALKAVA